MTMESGLLPCEPASGAQGLALGAVAWVFAKDGCGTGGACVAVA